MDQLNLPVHRAQSDTVQLLDAVTRRLARPAPSPTTIVTPTSISPSLGKMLSSLPI
jgi:hypothetical protein